METLITIPPTCYTTSRSHPSQISQNFMLNFHFVEHRRRVRRVPVVLEAVVESKELGILVMEHSRKQKATGRVARTQPLTHRLREEAEGSLPFGRQEPFLRVVALEVQHEGGSKLFPIYLGIDDVDRGSAPPC